MSVGLPAASWRSRHFHFSDSAPSMIASEEPWVRAPVVSPGALKRSASMRMQRCSISAVRGYSAWSMKLRWRFSAMICCASGSIQVVTKVARLRSGMPSRTSSWSISRLAAIGDMPCAGILSSGAPSISQLPPILLDSSVMSCSMFTASLLVVSTGSNRMRRRRITRWG